MPIVSFPVIHQGANLKSQTIVGLSNLSPCAATQSPSLIIFLLGTCKTNAFPQCQPCVGLGGSENQIWLCTISAVLRGWLGLRAEVFLPRGNWVHGSAGDPRQGTSFKQFFHGTPLDDDK